MKTLKYLLLSLFFVTIQLYSQKQVIGKTYNAQVSASCKEMNDGGGCMDYTYCEIKFEKDSALVSYTSREYCTPKSDKRNNDISEKIKYYYTIKKDIITIKNFNQYGKLSYFGNKLIGKKEMNYNEFIPLVFNQE